MSPRRRRPQELLMQCRKSFRLCLRTLMTTVVVVAAASGALAQTQHAFDKKGLLVRMGGGSGEE